MNEQYSAWLSTHERRINVCRPNTPAERKAIVLASADADTKKQLEALYWPSPARLALSVTRPIVGAKVRRR